MNITHPLSPRKKILVSIVVTAIATLGIAAFIIWPSLKEIRLLNEQIYAQRVELEKVYLKGKNLKQTLQEYREIKPTIDTLNAIYLKRGDELAFITNLEALANTHQVNQDLKLGSPSEKNRDSLPLQLTFTNTMQQFMRYLVGLEGLNYYINIDTIRLSTQSTRGAPDEHPLISAILLASTYIQP